MIPPGAKYHKGKNVLYEDAKRQVSVFCEEERWAYFFTPDEILGFFELAESDATEKDIEDFCVWLDRSTKVFIVSHHENHEANTTERAERKKTRKFYDEIDRHSTALIGLLHGSEKEFWGEDIEGQRLLNANELPDMPRNLQDSFCFKELNKHLPKGASGALSIGYMIEETTGIYDLVRQLVALKMTALALKQKQPSEKKGRNRTLDALNAFATEFAIKYRQYFKKPFTLLRHKTSEGRYDPVTPPHRIFAAIIDKVQFCLEERPVTDANIINALEHAQTLINKEDPPR